MSAVGKCSCLMILTLKAAFLGHSYDCDVSSSHWGTESDPLALKELGVNYVIFKVLIDKPIAYSLKRWVRVEAEGHCANLFIWMSN